MPEALPNVLQLRPTTNCPARCPTCTTHIKRGEPDLSFDDIAVNLAWFTEQHGVDELVFSGAEITLRPDFFDIVELVKSYDLQLVTLISSGLVWTDAMAQACTGVIDRVVVALTPVSAAAWHSERGCSARVRRSISLLIAAGVRVQTNTAITAGSIPALPDIATYIMATGIQAPIFLFPFGTGGARAVRAAGLRAWPDVMPAVASVFDTLESRSPRLKNVPPCAAGDLARFTARTSQRILVERGRQMGNHALIPPFVGMRYAVACQRCSLRPDCDGYWPSQVQAGALPCPAPVPR